MHSDCASSINKPHRCIVYQINWVLPTFPNFVYPGLAPNAPLILSRSFPATFVRSYAIVYNVQTYNNSTLILNSRDLQGKIWLPQRRLLE